MPTLAFVFGFWLSTSAYGPRAVLAAIATGGVAAASRGAGIGPGPLRVVAVAVHDVGAGSVAESVLALDVVVAPVASILGDDGRGHEEAKGSDGSEGLHLEWVGDFAFFW